MTTAAELRPVVLTLISHIPPGKVAIYGQVAALAGAPGYSRLVGRILRDLPADTRIPWFRVIGASGRITNPNTAQQRQRLIADGVDVSGTGRVDLTRFQWQP